MKLPRILIIDDMFGRIVAGGVNSHRDNLCANFLWQDVTGDMASKASQQNVLNPICEAFFFRGQTPLLASVGDVVENDLVGSLSLVRSGWDSALVKGELPWSMVLLDLCFYTGQVTEASNNRMAGMPVGNSNDDDLQGYFGLILLEAIRQEFPDLPTMILSSKPREDVSLEFTERGAVGFIDKVDRNAPSILQEALWQHGLLPDPNGEIIGNSLSVLLALREARRAARHRNNLLISGERGTGKELLANYVHRVSNPNQPFVTVNSAAFTPSLFSSELFGIESKTASGVDGKIGLITSADRGDLFLDEIADMSADVQAALLRVLQDGQITPIGARSPKNVDVRFLSATNADLEDEKRGFRPDLLDRLRLGGTLRLPPLRDRKTDVPHLVFSLLREAENQRQGSMQRTITPESLQILIAYDWPGNIRELKSCIYDAVFRHPDVEYLVPNHLRINKLKKNKIINGITPVETIIEDTTNNQEQFNEANITTLITSLKQIRFSQQQISQWAGKLSEIQLAQSWSLACYLEAALEATKRRTPEHPEGIIQIHPAIKLITGDSSITASKAADIVKRMLGPLEMDLKGMLHDAYNTAVRLRPKSNNLRESSTAKHLA